MEPGVANWVTVHRLPFLLYRYKVLPSPSFPVLTSCHFEKIQSVLSGWFPEGQACSEMLWGGASLVKWWFGTDPGREHHPFACSYRAQMTPRLCSRWGWVILISSRAFQQEENEHEEEKVCWGPWSSQRGRTVEITNAYAVGITITAWRKQLHSIDFSLLNELGREPVLFFTFPWENMSESMAIVFY